MEEKHVGGKKIGSVAGGNSGRALYKDERGIWGV